MFSLTDSSTYAHESLRLLTARDHIFLPHLAFHVYDITYTDISEHPETNLHLLETRNPLLFAGLLVSLVAQTSWDLCQLACNARPPTHADMVLTNTAAHEQTPSASYHHLPLLATVL